MSLAVKHVVPGRVRVRARQKNFFANPCPTRVCERATNNDGHVRQGFCCSILRFNATHVNLGAKGLFEIETVGLEVIGKMREFRVIVGRTGIVASPRNQNLVRIRNFKFYIHDVIPTTCNIATTSRGIYCRDRRAGRSSSTARRRPRPGCDRLVCGPRFS